MKFCNSGNSNGIFCQFQIVNMTKSHPLLPLSKLAMPFYFPIMKSQTDWDLRPTFLNVSLNHILTMKTTASSTFREVIAN